MLGSSDRVPVKQSTTYATNGKIQALHCIVLSLGDRQESGVVIYDRSCSGSIRSECICKGPIRENEARYTSAGQYLVGG